MIARFQVGVIVHTSRFIIVFPSETVAPVAYRALYVKRADAITSCHHYLSPLLTVRAPGNAPGDHAGPDSLDLDDALATSTSGIFWFGFLRIDSDASVAPENCANLAFVRGVEFEVDARVGRCR